MNSQIKNYLSLGAAYMAGFSANASIYYTDFDPDIWWQWDYSHFEFPVDVDHDGLNDYRFFTFESATEYYSCSGFAGAFFIEAYRSNLIGNTLLPVPTPSYIFCSCVGMPDSFYNLTMGVRPAFSGDLISFGDQWGDAQLLLASHDCQEPEPVFGLITPTNDYDYYIPIQLRDHGIHYGWIRLNHRADIAEKIIFDMAYETIENIPVVAGAFTDEIEIAIAPNVLFENTNDGIIIHSFNLGQSAEFILTDISGKIIQSDKINNTDIFISNKSISKGVYLITVNAPEGKWVKKFLNTR